MFVNSENLNDASESILVIIDKPMQDYGIHTYKRINPLTEILNQSGADFGKEDEMKIKKMFKDIQKPFAIYCPKNRKNFLNYSYVLHKFCELLGLDEYINYFPLLKNNAKRLQHDKIWENICTYMGQKYYKSI